MITVQFTNGEVQIGNPKKTRAWLRKKGLTIRNGTKQGDLWIFDCENPDGSPVKFLEKEPCEIKPMPQFYSGDMSPDRRPITQTMQNLREDGTVSLKTIEVDVDAVLQRKIQRTIHHTPILGKDLEVGDSLMDFVPGKHLTIDSRGIHEIVIPAPNITRQENRFLGFYSLESRGMSSYKIDPEETYDVIR